MPQSRRRKSGGKRIARDASGRRLSSRGEGTGKKSKVVVILIVAVAVAGAAYLLAPSAGGPSSGDEVTTASGLRYTDIEVGTGPSPQAGQTAVVHYTGTLQDGTKFDSSHDRGQPFEFPLGRGRVIRGWDEGVATMRVGGRRRLVIPSSLGYGERGSPPKIPGGATLIFDVELLDVR